MEIIYRAKDGKEFNDEYECQKYELELAFISLNCKLLDKDMQPTLDPGAVCHAKFNSFKDIEEFNNFCYKEGVEEVECEIDETKPLAFYYDNSNYHYIQYGVKVEELENELSNLKEQYENLLSM